ncbi:LysR family transcriptional regulator [Microbaculum marinum]|uniref:LysR family transcriptional regulator n=1 Tax=Microbaculum marinum TaxID=1764581 RepID=A0AAW9S3X3_9HYPH
MIRNLDTALVRTFVTVAGCRNMTVAADRLALTQGAVSQQIRRLEDVLQVALFDRDRRGLKLTPQGERLLGLSKRFLEINDEILSEMNGAAVRGKVRFGIPHDLVTSCLPRVLPAFADANPNVDVELVCGSSPDLSAAIDRGDVDVALVEERADSARGECLGVERLLWIGARNGTAHRKRPLPLSIVSETCVFRQTVHEALRDEGVDWRMVFENGNIDATMTTVRTDMAVTPSLASFVPPDLRVLPPDAGLPQLPNFSIGLFVRSGDTDRAVDELAAHIRRAFVGEKRDAA